MTRFVVMIRAEVVDAKNHIKVNIETLYFTVGFQPIDNLIFRALLSLIRRPSKISSTSVSVQDQSCQTRGARPAGER